MPAALTYNETGVPAALSGKEEKKENGFCERTEGFKKNKTARQNLAGCESVGHERLAVPKKTESKSAEKLVGYFT